MTEVIFARSFLAALDSRPQKLSADHVEDPKSYPARAPVGLSTSKAPCRVRVAIKPMPKLTLAV